MRKLFSILTVALVAMSFAACSGGGKTPESIVEKELSCRQKQDFDGMLKTMYFKEEMNDEQRDMVKSMFDEKVVKEDESKGGLKSWEILETEMAEDGQSAVVKYKMVYGDESEKEDNANVLLNDGNWLIDSGK